ncbi:HD domain-containing protein [Cellvibrio mixtus]|uniref:HD domain-containing protein n=1 Tax=Cellvibrio mixtus TaxID=39650 RepID=UPI000586CB93|nr:ATP-binding protein [Cellvibrio mixtus]
MSSLLLKRLNQLSNEDKNLEILAAQWAFDERLIGKALANIGTIFGHYSRHDESHSKQILINIERVLGNHRIDLLSATDIWMLLECAYLHDIGMVIPIDLMRKDWSSKEFQEFFNESTTAKELRDIFGAISQEKPFDLASWPIDFYEKMKFIMSEYYRAKHPQRSDEIAKNPLHEISLSSPRTELLPKRIFNLIGRICYLHGQPFEEVMKLPKVEVGIGNDDVHPRLIASLLRLGDLLDLDNNRFCPVMLSCAGNVPDSTLSHIEKHFSINSFYASPSNIEVEAVCETYAGYSETQKWFSYLKDELSCQMNSWHEIIPAISFGALPTIGKLNIQLMGYELIDGKNVPRFEIDKKRIFDIVTGSEIYSHKEQAIRELLQNAIDACLVRIWIEYSGSKNFDEPSVETLDFIKNKVNIDISISKKIIQVSGRTAWRVTIKDNGTGMDYDGIRSIQSIGSSRRGSLRKTLSKMPAWMRPSGSFGLGFQSVFLLTQEVDLTTRYLGSYNQYFINLKSPGSGGDILISKSTVQGVESVGTSISFDFEYDTIPNAFTISPNMENSLRALRDHDPVVGNGLDIDIARVVDEIEKFFRFSIFNCSLTFDGEIINIKDVDLPPYVFYSEKNEIQILNLNFGPESAASAATYYKWQPFDSRLAAIPFVRSDINILGYDASDILQLSRNQLKKSKGLEVKQKIISSLNEYFLASKSKSNEEDFKYIDAFLIFHGFDPIYDGKHKDIAMGEGVTIGDVINADKILFYQVNVSDHNTYVSPVISNDDGVIKIKSNAFRGISLRIQFLQILLEKNGRRLGVEVHEHRKNLDADDDRLMFSLMRDSKTVISDNALQKMLGAELWGAIRHKRNLILCESDYIELAIDKNKINGYFDTINYDYAFGYYPNLMIFPFLIEERKAGPERKAVSERKAVADRSAELLNYIYENRKDNSVTKEKISEKLECYISRIKKLMFNKPMWR